MTESLQWLGQVVRPDAPGFWLLFDLLAAAGLWLLLPHAPLRWRSLLRVLRWLLVPWLALMLGALAPQAMGITDIDWQTGLTTGLGIVLTVLVLVALVRYATHTGASSTPVDGTVAVGAGQTCGIALYAFLFHGVEQYHWCFQRAAVTALLLTAPAQLDTPAYWAIWIATLLALPGILRLPDGITRLYSLIALLATAILFFYTRNFWLCWLLHGVIMLLAGSTHTRPALQADSASRR